MTAAFVRLIASAGLAFVLSGCASLSYFAESLDGHAKIMASRRKVDTLVADPATPDALRAQMETAGAIRRFATDELALPDNASYTTYVDTGRDHVTYAVFAAPEFSLAPAQWCFPVFGCVPYRGYFSIESAREFALGLKGKGLDVHLSGVTAYSTLGWFSDPLLNTMFQGDDTDIAALVFHELSHQRVYVDNDSAFNEAFAVAVETTGVRKWLRAAGDAEGLRRYEAALAREDDFRALVGRTREELAHIYASADGPERKRARKAAALKQLRTAYRRMRDGRWGGFRAYDGWFDAPINNAKLAATSVYSDRVPAFLRLFDLCAGDYPRFYAAVRRIGALDMARRRQALDAAKACE